MSLEDRVARLESLLALPSPGAVVAPPPSATTTDAADARRLRVRVEHLVRAYDRQAAEISALRQQLSSLQQPAK
jgi:hypothetical protein